MSKMLLSAQIDNQEDSEDNIAENDEVNNYKGLFHDEDEPEQRYYECGAHFSFKDLCRKLESFYELLGEDRKGTSMYEPDPNTGNKTFI
jgi:hypothetical protein